MTEDARRALCGVPGRRRAALETSPQHELFRDQTPWGRGGSFANSCFFFLRGWVKANTGTGYGAMPSGPSSSDVPVPGTRWH